MLSQILIRKNLMAMYHPHNPNYNTKNQDFEIIERYQKALKLHHKQHLMLMLLNVNLEILPCWIQLEWISSKEVEVSIKTTRTTIDWCFTLPFRKLIHSKTTQGHSKILWYQGYPFHVDGLNGSSTWSLKCIGQIIQSSQSRLAFSQLIHLIYTRIKPQNRIE